MRGRPDSAGGHAVLKAQQKTSSFPDSNDLELSTEGTILFHGLTETSNLALDSTNARAQHEPGSTQRKQRDCSDRMAIQPMSSQFCILLAFATLPLSAHWLNHIPTGTPMKDGRPNLSAPAPRAANGKPELTGVWMHETFSLEQMK